MATPKSELLPVLPMDDVVVLPHMSVTLAVEGDSQKAAIEAARQGNRLVLLVPRLDGKFGAIGTAARLGESAELPTGAEAFMMRGEYRARLGSGQADIGGALWVKADPILDPEPPTEKALELAREYRALREYLLRQQMEAIKKQLNEGQTDVVSGYRERIANAGMPENVLTEVNRELDRLERTSEQNPEYGWIRTYLDWMLDIPWNVRSEDNYDLVKARQILDEDHTGLGDVKDRIIEFLAVRKLRQERGLEVLSGRGSGAIITLVGPPGVGKTSLGESVARALGRKFTRVSLGGIRDEADIRGHRRTYVGALPGRIVRALKDAGTKNPVIMLDEIDKVGSDWRGDPSSALLEVLDPAQNHTFRDHYLEVDLDLSEVLFIPTANVSETIPAPLLDRMELIRLDGYTEEEKVAIARDHLLKRQVRQAGLKPDEVTVDDAAIMKVITDHTREAGVRNLERQLGDVMKESAQIALSYVRSHADELKIPHDAINKSFHIHVPEGAVPKDGPSAGVTMTTALVSLLTGRPVRNTVAMTGEVSLQGLVLPIGGVKQKVLAAHRMGLTEVILPKRNEKDIDDVPQSVREKMTFHLASRVEDVLKHALEPASTTKSKTEAA